MMKKAKVHDFVALAKKYSWRIYRCINDECKSKTVDRKVESDEKVRCCSDCGSKMVEDQL